ncbi:MAG: 4-hydroxy-tetrahydrodipicolinate synthase [Candidatus Hydrogenedentota bacterium]
MSIRIEGIIPAMVTPFTKGGKQVDYEKAAGVAQHLAKKKVQGLFIAGTTGEGMLMSVAERKKLLETVIAAVGKHLKVIAHTGNFDTPSTIELTEHAAQAGAAAAGVVVPGFYTLDDDAITNHYKLVAASVKGFPILLYNIPGCAKNVLKPAVTIKLAKEVENIIGMKDSGGSISALNEVLAGKPKDFAVINGVDEYSMQAYAAGAQGSVSSTANVVPEIFLEIYGAAQKGDWKKAWASQIKLSNACKLYHYGARVAFYKEGLRLKGVDSGFVRPPQRELSAAEAKAFAKGVKDAGLV